MKAILQGPSAQSRALLSAKVDEPPVRKCRTFKMQTVQFAMAYNQGKLCNKRSKCIAEDRRMRYMSEGGTPSPLKEGIRSVYRALSGLGGGSSARKPSPPKRLLTS